MGEEGNPELEHFRKQWKEEVTARSKGASSKGESKDARPLGSLKGGSATDSSTKAPTSSSWSFANLRKDEEIWDGLQTQSYHDLENKDDARRLGEEGTGIHPEGHRTRDPRSALEHYEKAVERETEGNLGDSLNLYRKAFRLDAGVDRIYKNKHFPPSVFKSKPTNPNPSNAPVTVPNPAHHSLGGPPGSSISQLVASFASLSIPPAEPLVEGSPPPSCPISVIPSEILVNIMLQTAIVDVASFARLSLVCKSFAYLVATDDNIWKRICLGSEYGFGAMWYAWGCSISGYALEPDLDTVSLTSLSLSSEHKRASSPSPFPLSSTYPTYAIMFRQRPRIRFNGCYISTVNYIRPGASTASQVSWNTPVHVVTYYRYLRFFRDGSCCSLLTTAEPADVVHYLTKENIHLHEHGQGLLPNAVMRHALRGRWRLSGNQQDINDNSKEEEEEEGTLLIETEGVDPDKYIFKMELALKSAGRAGGTRNNKLNWKGFWSYNKLTDDWAEFGLRNDKAFFWSRVRSYGMGC